jgi:hypothetical protein
MPNMKVELQYIVAYHTLQICMWLLTFGRIYWSMFGPERGGNIFIDVVGNNLPACMVLRPGRKKNLIFIDAENLSATLVINIWCLGTFAKLRKANISFVMSVRLSVHLSAWSTSAFIGRIFMKFDISLFFWQSGMKIQLSLQSDKNNGLFT